MEGGIRLEGSLTYLARVREISALPFNYSITIHDNRKRQVHRMFERVGQPLLALKRMRIGGLRLGSLKDGEVRRLSCAEIKALLS